jgi:hypothetical protein
MDSFTNIFEQPWLLLAIGIIMFVAVFVLRDLLPPRYKWLFLFLPVIIIGLAFAIDYLVQTDNEKVRTVVSKIVKAAEQENVDAIDKLISGDYQDSFHGSKQSLMRHCRARLAEPIIEKNVLRFVSVKINNPGATAVFTVRVVFEPRGPVSGFAKEMLFKMQADLKKTGSNWLITKMEVLEINLQPASWQLGQGAGEVFN